MAGIDQLANNPQLMIEGKTKRVWYSSTQGEVLIESKDDITAGDGARRDEFEGKAELATETTANCFELLERAGIPTHFRSRYDDIAFRADEVTMIPIELVTRRIAFGSYLKRNQEVEPKTEFEEVEFEMFAKDDAKHDPLLDFDFESGYISQYSASEPISDQSLLSMAPFDTSKFALSFEEAVTLRQLAIETFSLLEAQPGMTKTSH